MGKEKSPPPPKKNELETDIFEHQNNRQIKSNAAVREPSLAEQHWMQRIVGQGRGGRGGLWPLSMGFLDDHQWICPLAEKLVSHKKNKKIDGHTVHF
jgi:hypothetical protein